MTTPPDPSKGCRRIGILEMASPDKERLAHWDIFRHWLREHGHVEERDVVLEFRWADGLQDRLASAADELVSSAVDVIVTAGTPAAAAAIRATSTIPIIMATGVSVGTKLSDGGAKANNNVTGISDLPPGVSEKRLTLLREVIDAPLPLAILADRSNPSSPLAVRETQDVARSAGLAVKDYWLSGPEQFESMLMAMKNDGVGGFVVAPGAMFFAKRNELAASALKYRLASMSVRREYAEAGCLMAYGSPLRENYRQAASFVSRVLAGTKPADIPVDEPTEFDFVINLATAQAIGLTVPASLRERAEIITN
jgi:putative tryptophan/tyrosine transport system substrate-binding protein